MNTVGTAEAKAKLSELLDRVENGEDVIIERYGKPVARLTRISEEPKRVSIYGALKGQGWIADDFNAPLPPEIQDYFDGKIDDFTDEPIEQAR